MAYAHDFGRYAGREFSRERAELGRQLDLAAEWIERDPDGASLLLDGLIWRIVAARYMAHHGAPPSRERLLAELDEDEPGLARWARLALRAPDARARLVHAQHLYSLVFEPSLEDEPRFVPSQVASGEVRG